MGSLKSSFKADEKSIEKASQRVPVLEKQTLVLMFLFVILVLTVQAVQASQFLYSKAYSKPYLSRQTIKKPVVKNINARQKSKIATKKETGETKARSLTSQTIHLVQGWNYVSLPVVPSNDIYAEDVCTLNGVVEVVRWHRQLSSWGGHPCGVPVGNFKLDLYKGYFVKVRNVQSVEWVILGYSLPQCSQAADLAYGINDVVCDGQSYPSDICRLDGEIKEVVRWDEGVGNWASHVCGTHIGDVMIQANEPVMILKTSSFEKSNGIIPTIPHFDR